MESFLRTLFFFSQIFITSKWGRLHYYYSRNSFFSGNRKPFYKNININCLHGLFLLRRRRFEAAVTYPKRRRFGYLKAAPKQCRFEAVLSKTTLF